MPWNGTHKQDINKACRLLLMPLGAENHKRMMIISLVTIN